MSMNLSKPCIAYEGMEMRSQPNIPETRTTIPGGELAGRFQLIPNGYPVERLLLTEPGQGEGAKTRALLQFLHPVQEGRCWGWADLEDIAIGEVPF